MRAPGASSDKGAARSKSFPIILATFFLGVIVVITMIAGRLGPWSEYAIVIHEDDRPPVALKTRGKTVEAALAAAKIVLDEADVVAPPLDAPVTDGDEIHISRALSVLLEVDGVETTVSLQPGTVRDALVAGQVRMGSLDRVVPIRETPLTEGMNIRVIRVTQEEVDETETIPFATTTWADPHLETGEQRLVRAGKEGLLRRVYQVTYENGTLAHRRLLRNEVVETAVDEIIGVGTRESQQVLQTATGTYVYAEVFDMEATAYYPGPESTGEWADGYTFTGLLAGRGVVAVDPTVIPLGTRVYVPGYGEAVAADIGGAIKGHRIDLGFPTYEEAIQYGRRSVKVYVLADR